VTVRSEDRDGVRVLSLARPPVNALDFALVRALGAAFESAADARCRALVVTGMPGVFSAGIDTKRLAGYDARERAEMLRGVNRTLLALYALEKPCVAAISGHALGAGLVLALACDARIAAVAERRPRRAEARSAARRDRSRSSEAIVARAPASSDSSPYSSSTGEVDGVAVAAPRGPPAAVERPVAQSPAHRARSGATALRVPFRTRSGTVAERHFVRPPTGAEIPAFRSVPLCGRPEGLLGCRPCDGGRRPGGAFGRSFGEPEQFT
jgi:hypothetical protein